jgi:hypothetical protein
MLARVNRCAVSAALFLVAIALVAGMAGCGSPLVEIHDWYDLDAVRDNLKGDYILMNDLDSTTPGYEELAGGNGNEGEGWLPIGTEDDAFAGSLDGQGYEIRDLIICCSGFSHVGVFGFVDEGGRIEDIGVGYAEVIGDEAAGGLVAVCYGTVIDCYSMASVDGRDCVGGLVGENHGTVTDSYCSGTVSGEAVAGGLIGQNYGTVTDSYFTGSVSGEAGVGGLVGWNWNEGTVSNSHAMGTVICSAVVAGGLVGVNEGTVTNSCSAGGVTGDMEVGGLVGMNGWYMDGYSNPGTVTNSYCTGSVTGKHDVGGLVGGNGYESIVSDSYATGNVDGEREVGGLVGGNAGSVSDSYSTGNATGEADVGGLVGANYGTVSNCFWDTKTSGQTTSDGGTGKTATQMKNITTFSGAGWNIIPIDAPDDRNPSYIWNIVDAVTYPFLSW